MKWEKLQGQTFVYIHVRNPEEYFRRGNALQRFLRRMNQRTFGTGLSIPANQLGSGLEEFLAVFDGALAARE